MAWPAWHLPFFQFYLGIKLGTANELGIFGCRFRQSVGSGLGFNTLPLMSQVLMFFLKVENNSFLYHVIIVNEKDTLRYNIIKCWSDKPKENGHFPLLLKHFKVLLRKLLNHSEMIKSTFFKILPTYYLRQKKKTKKATEIYFL